MGTRSGATVDVTNTGDPTYWARPTFIDKRLAKMLGRGSVSLVLGAGASAGFMLPGWDRLVEDIYTDVGATMPTKSTSPTALADALKRTHFKDRDLEFSKVVRKVLYKDYSASATAVLTSPLLQAIGSFLASSMRGSAGSLITFNFDDLVETYLQTMGFVVTSEPKAPFWKLNADMQVLHPHGLLPIANEAACTNIVFTDSDYVRVIGRAADAWNASMHATLSGTTAVFVGLSGDDLRLRSVLEQVKESHVATKSGHAYWAVRATLKTEDDTRVEMWRELGVAPRFLDAYADIPAWLLGICRQSAATMSSRLVR